MLYRFANVVGKPNHGVSRSRTYTKLARTESRGASDESYERGDTCATHPRVADTMVSELCVVLHERGERIERSERAERNEQGERDKTQHSYK